MFCALLVSMVAVSGFAQITPSDDSYILSSLPTTNFGAKNILIVQGPGATTFIRFDLSSLPSTATGSLVAKATLKVYVSAVTATGTFEVDRVTSAWTESTITFNTPPTIGTAIASAVPATKADKNQYVLVDVTAAVKEWLSGTTNNGIAIVPDGTVSLSLNSKETTTTSHSPELDIVFAGITGITTASGSGLIGGGTSGTLNLSLTNACAANQVLQWSGTAWGCANLKGNGTITGVIAGTDLTGGGSSGVVTLNLDTTKVPQLSTANTFTQLQTINNQVLIRTTVGGQALIAFGTGGANGIQGNTDSTGGTGIGGVATSSTGNAVGVVGASFGPNGTGGSFQGATGVSGQSSVCCAGVGGEFTGATPPSGSSANATLGVLGVGGNSGLAVTSDGAGGLFQGGSKGMHGDGIDAVAGSGFAGNFSGDLNVSGAVIAGTKDFKIDHPSDPANKYLVHASVESSEMMNIYTGNVTTDAQGEAVVNLPEWFETLNGDFRYQLTVIGQFAQAIVGSKISDHRFTVRTDKPNVEVSWQVTGVRHDPFAKAHPLVVEEQKDTRLRGFYIHPELYGAPEEKQIEWARHPEMMKEMRARQLAASQATAARAGSQPLAVQHGLTNKLPPTLPAPLVKLVSPKNQPAQQK